MKSPRWMIVAVLAFLGSIAASAASGAFITTSVVGGTFTWTVDTTSVPGGIASIHINGPAGASADSGQNRTQPAGWNWTGNTASGDYSWENPTGNTSGTALVFSASFSGVTSSGAATSVSYDTLSGTTRTVVPLTAPTTPTTANWAFTPVPEPSTAMLVGLGFCGVVRKIATDVKMSSR